MDIGNIEEFFPEINGLTEKKEELLKANTELKNLQKRVIDLAREKDRKGGTIWVDPSDYSPELQSNNTTVLYLRLSELIKTVRKLEEEVKKLEKVSEKAKVEFEALKTSVANKEDTVWNNSIGSISLDE